MSDRRVACADVLGAIAEAIWARPEVASEILGVAETCLPGPGWETTATSSWFEAHDRELLSGKVPAAVTLALWCAGEYAESGDPFDIEWAAQVCRSADELLCANCRVRLLGRDDLDCPCGD